MNKRVVEFIISIVDCLCIVCSFFIAILTRHGSITFEGFDALYRNAILVLIVLYLIISIRLRKKKPRIFIRGYLSEFLFIGQSFGMTLLIWFGYLFLTKQTAYYSRLIIISFIILGVLSTFVVRSYEKLLIFLIFKHSKDTNICTVITVKKYAEEVLTKFFNENQWNIKINGIILVDEDLVGKKILGVEVIGNIETFSNALLYGAVDEVFIYIPYGCKINLKTPMKIFRQMGITAYLSINRYNVDIQKGFLNTFAGHQVISFANAINRK